MRIANGIIGIYKKYDKKSDENLRDLINPKCRIEVRWPVGLQNKYLGIPKIYEISKDNNDSCMLDDENERSYLVFESKDGTKYYKAVVDLGGCGGGPCRIFDKIEILN